MSAVSTQAAAAKACALASLLELRAGAQRGRLAYRALIRGRTGPYRRLLPGTKRARRAASRLSTCTTSVTPSTPVPAPSPVPTPAPTPEQPPPPAPRPQAASARISYFKGFPAVVGPELAEPVSPGGTATRTCLPDATGGPQSEADYLFGWFSYANVAFEALEAYWNVPTGEWVRARMELDVVRGLGAAGLKARDGFKLPNGTYTLVVAHGDEILDDAWVAVCTP
jgi:hypothetical protein